MLSRMVWLYLVLVGLIRSQVSEGATRQPAVVDAFPGSPTLLSPTIAGSSADRDIGYDRSYTELPPRSYLLRWKLERW